MTTKLGVVALAGPDNGGTYQYTLSMLQGLQHITGFEITLYGDPANPDFTKFGYPIRRFAESHARQSAALAIHWIAGRRQTRRICSRPTSIWAARLRSFCRR